MKNNTSKAMSIRAVVSDLAGTMVDYGSCAPAGAFVAIFRQAGVSVTHEEAREPMGIGKREHIEAIFRMPRISRSWKEVYGRDWAEEDVDRLYEQFVPLQIKTLSAYKNLIPGVYETLTVLDRMGIRVGVTTGYTEEMTRVVLEGMREQGVRPAAFSCVSFVPAGRPAPWMIFDVMKQLDVYPPKSVVAIGDTLADIEAGRNAGVWTVGVTRTGNMLGMTEREVGDLDATVLAERLAQASEVFYNAGADFVVESFAELPVIIDRINERTAAENHTE